MGVSQWTLIGRYIIEKCNMKGEVQNYVSFMGPQMWVSAIPNLKCGLVCKGLNVLVSTINYANPQLTDRLGPASYWKYRFHYDQYMRHNTYLKDLKNEGPKKNANYKKRIISLNKMLLVKGSLVNVIIPKKSSWFEFYDQAGIRIRN